jgi:hypothetical protein
MSRFRTLGGLLVIALGCSSAPSAPSDSGLASGADASAPSAPSDSGQASTGSTISEADLAGIYPGVLCDMLVACCTAAGHPYDKQTCLLETELPQPWYPYQTNYDGARASECISSIRATAGVCTIARELERRRVCSQIYAGQPAGGPCGTYTDCAGSLDGRAICEHDKCAPVQYVSVGGACQSDPPVGCMDGLYCTTGGACAALPKAGESCDGAPGCAKGLGCSGGTCNPLAANGESCYTNESCVSGICRDSRCVASEPFDSLMCAL